MKRKIEIFTAGCPVCEEQVELLKKETCTDCEIIVSNINTDKKALERSKSYKIKSIPAVVIDNVLAGCCSKAGIDIEVLRSMGLGKQN